MSCAISEADPVLAFLRCRTPQAWLDRALSGLSDLLLDHATLELKAAQQAQKLIWKYGTGSRRLSGVPDQVRIELVKKMSRLAREELKHFERVVRLLERRSIPYRTLSASRYAAALHAEIRDEEPARLVDTLIVGAIIEARSCERFAALAPSLAERDRELARFYESLLVSEARHFEDYLQLARSVGGAEAHDEIEMRIDAFLRLESRLVSTPDNEHRFHSGVPDQGGVTVERMS